MTGKASPEFERQVGLVKARLLVFMDGCQDAGIHPDVTVSVLIALGEDLRRRFDKAVGGVP